MEKIDVLGFRPDRHHVFTQELLKESEDNELQEIVKRAATELSSPIALVSLILDHIQFFKAHVGLPPVLAASRGTHRDASFCQFVVKSKEIFEVTDAPNDPRIPQHVVTEFNIQAYLGVPILVEDVVVGSLCVLDTKKREFSSYEKDFLTDLAKHVNERLRFIAKCRQQTRLSLTERALQPGLKELAKSIKPIQQNMENIYSSSAAIRSFLNLSKFSSEIEMQVSDAFRLSLESALRANAHMENLFYEIDFAAADCKDCIDAMERLVLNSKFTKLSEVIIAAQDLSRHTTKLVGGFSLPEIPNNPFVYAKANLATALITNCLLSISSKLIELESEAGIQLNLKSEDGNIKLRFYSPDLNETSCDCVASSLSSHLGDEPSIKIEASGKEIWYIFKTIDFDDNYTSEINMSNFVKKVQQ